MDQQNTPDEPKKLDTGTRLAVDRTRLAAERTLMAWIRTGFSMISFGFTLYRFFEYLNEAEGQKHSLHGPRNMGLFLIVLGTLSIALGAVEHRRMLKQIGEVSGERPWSLAMTIAILVALLGVLAFASIFARVGPL
jgi:putative membrane protein